ncbi:MAG: hypothetical protein PHY45_07365 [Rhodocyclaceae bacterium]|nr:hypothetical protein [Rhodocyclaceae bacterium]
MSDCTQCLHCEDDPGSIERLLPGMNILSSAYGNTRGITAICQHHDMFISPGLACADFRARPGLAAAAAASVPQHR